MFIKIKTLDIPQYNPTMVEVAGEIIQPGDPDLITVTPTVRVVVDAVEGQLLRLGDVLRVDVRNATAAEIEELKTKVEPPPPAPHMTRADQRDF
jgi:hypothetical protein